MPNSRPSPSNPHLRRRMADQTNTLPDECLALIFSFLTTSRDRYNSSRVCHRWLRIDGQARRRLSLVAHPDLQPFIPSIFTRYNSLTKLVLHSDVYSHSINDHGFGLIASRCPNLTRLKLVGCRSITEKGMAILSQNCRKLKKFSCSMCSLGGEGIVMLLNTCSSLEELSVRQMGHGYLYKPLSIVSNSLKTLKLIHCGEKHWDKCLEMITVSGNSLVKLHLEYTDLSDIGLVALSKCSNLQVLHLQGLENCTSDALISAVESFKGLKKLYIDERMRSLINNDVVFAIAKYCLNVEELGLIGVDVRCIGLEAIVVNCQKLERLDLCSTETITDVEISHITDKCVALRKVSIKERCASIFFEKELCI